MFISSVFNEQFTLKYKKHKIKQDVMFSRTIIVQNQEYNGHTLLLILEIPSRSTLSFFMFFIYFICV